MRYLATAVEAVLSEDRKMAFVAGPRQVGKTTLARHLLGPSTTSYFNWDIEDDRRRIVRDPTGFFRARLPRSPAVARPRIAIDEIHKYPRWKRFLKGLFDAEGRGLEIIVTGSGRLDVYQHGGDSLFGRYHLHSLHPFTVGELIAGGRQAPGSPDDFVAALRSGAARPGASEALERIERFTGFPEPLHAGRDVQFRRWRRNHQELVVRQDLRDLTRIQDLGLIDALALLLPDRVGSPLSLNSLAVDLGVAFNSVRHWMDALGRLYFLFALRPYAGRLARTLRREEKVYLHEPTRIAEPGARFENVVASHLLKICDLWSDRGDGDFDLWYVRDKEKREVDFLVTESRRPWLLVETKLSDPSPAAPLRYFCERLRPRHGAVQIVRGLPGPQALDREGGVWVVDAATALALM